MSRLGVFQSILVIVFGEHLGRHGAPPIPRNRGGPELSAALPGFPWSGDLEGAQEHEPSPRLGRYRRAQGAAKACSRSWVLARLRDRRALLLARRHPRAGRRARLMRTAPAAGSFSRPSTGPP
jgi:hypothetical protein